MEHSNWTDTHKKSIRIKIQARVNFYSFHTTSDIRFFCFVVIFPRISIAMVMINAMNDR